MPRLAEFEAILKRNEPLAPYTYLKLGGPAEMLVQPRSHEELSAVVRRCFQEHIPLRVLGSGCNMLVRDEGVRGRRAAAERAGLHRGRGRGQARPGRHRGGGVGADLGSRRGTAWPAWKRWSASPARSAGPCGPTPATAPATSVSSSARSRCSTAPAPRQVRERDELQFGEHASNLDDPVLLTVEFALESDDPDAIVKRMRKAWILRKATQPAAYQAAGRIFKNPRGLSAAGPDRAGRAGADARRRRRGQRPRRQLFRRPSRRHQPRRAAADRAGPQPGQGAVQRRSGTGGYGVVKAAPALLFLIAASCCSAACSSSAGWPCQSLHDQPRYQIVFGDIECTPPPGLTREVFLEEVQMLASFPDSACALDDGLPARLSAAFAKHPWVEQVQGVEVGAPKRVRVRLAYRTAVLRVRAKGDDKERAVDRFGVRLPDAAVDPALPLLTRRRWNGRRARRAGPGATTASRRRADGGVSSSASGSISSSKDRDRTGRPDASGRRRAHPLGGRPAASRWARRRRMRRCGGCSNSPRGAAQLDLRSPPE